MQHKTILGIDAGTREMGLTVLRGRELRYFGVRTLRNGTRPYDVISLARRIVLAVVALSPASTIERVTGNPRATKIEVAEHLARSGFDQLKSPIPRRPARPALWLQPKDKNWLHMFDALALAVADERLFHRAS
jgi:Holliday junction resolvasome RuvABC endonuclease subunit